MNVFDYPRLHKVVRVLSNANCHLARMGRIGQKVNVRDALLRWHMMRGTGVSDT
jgi:hypothetical protein